MNAPQRLTDLLLAWREGGHGVDANQLNQEIYLNLKRMAAARWHGAGTPLTLNPTALVNEAVLRLLDGNVDWTSRAHFFALAALQMRAVLVDYARSRGAGKRGGGMAAVTLDGIELGVATDDELLDLDAALNALAHEDARSARVIELTYFGGMPARDVATVVGVGVTTIENDLAYGRAWLRTRLAG